LLLGALNILHRVPSHLLNQLGCIDSICFGSECGDLHLLKEIAQILADEPIEYQTALKQALKEGASFPGSKTGGT